MWTRRSWVTAAGAAAAIVVGLTVAFVARRGVRAWYWDGLCTRPLTADERRDLASCEPPGFGVLTKVVATDEPSPCGEPWLAHALARHARGGDQAAWLTERSVAPSTPDGGRVRASLALALAGREPLVHAAWMRVRLSPERRADFVPALVDPELAPLFGPAGVALGLAERLATGDVTPAEAAPALRWLAGLGDPEADDAVLRAVSAASADDRLDDGSRGPCEGDGCVRAALATLEDQLAREALARGEPVGGPPPLDGALDGLLGELGWSAADRAGMDWQVSALRAWVDGHPDRLRSLWVRTGRGPVARLGWDGAGTPFLAATVLAAVAPAQRFRADRAGAVWTEVDGRWVVRRCVAEDLEPPAADWPVAAVRARAALEAGGPAAARLAARLDPVVPPPPATGDPVAYGLGAALRWPTPLAGADEERARVVDGFCD